MRWREGRENECVGRMGRERGRERWGNKYSDWWSTSILFPSVGHSSETCKPKCLLIIFHHLFSQLHLSLGQFTFLVTHKFFFLWDIFLWFFSFRLLFTYLDFLSFLGALFSFLLFILFFCFLFLFLFFYFLILLACPEFPPLLSLSLLHKPPTHKNAYQLFVVFFFKHLTRFAAVLFSPGKSGTGLRTVSLTSFFEWNQLLVPYFCYWLRWSNLS